MRGVFVEILWEELEEGAVGIGNFGDLGEEYGALCQSCPHLNECFGCSWGCVLWVAQWRAARALDSQLEGLVGPV